jgi:hypothetical protein
MVLQALLLQLEGNGSVTFPNLEFYLHEPPNEIEVF